MSDSQEPQKTTPYRDLAHALLQGQPYFGPAMAAAQGPPGRKAYMRALVRYLVSEDTQPRHPATSAQILEIGSWAGTSTVTWAQAIRDFAGDGRVTCVDVWKPYFDLHVNGSEIYHAMEHAAQSGDIHRLFLHNIRSAGVEDLIDYLIGDSRVILPTLTDDKYDIVFIDGAHVYDVVSSDISNAKRLVRDGGIICGDDLELTLAEVDLDAHRTILRAGFDFATDVRTGNAYHPAVTQAVADAFPEVANYDGLWAVRRHRETFKSILLPAGKVEIPPHLETMETHPQLYELPKLVGDHRGFNIVHVAEGYLGLRQSLGVVSIDRGAQEIIEHLGFGNAVFGKTISETVAHIESAVLTSEAADLKSAIQDLRDHFLHAIQDLRDHFLHALDRVERLSDRTDELEKSTATAVTALHRAIMAVARREKG
jgi:predicted O-methyltransferase YrrM